MSNLSRINVGAPPPGFCLDKAWYSVSVCFHDFLHLDKTKGSKVESEPFYCLGHHEWKVHLYPGGHMRARRPDSVSIYLQHCSDSKISADFELHILNSRGAKAIKNASRNGHVFGQGVAQGWKKAVSSHAAKRSLVDGALVIKVLLRPKSAFYIQVGRTGNLMKLFGDEESSDIAFNVRDQVFFAHKLIMKVHAPDLLDLCEMFDKATPMPIDDVHPEIFLSMLKTLYGGILLADDWTNDAKSILNAADKYGFQGLKTEAEKWYVKATRLTAKNAIHELLLADGNGYHLIKQTALDFVVANAEQVLASQSFHQLHESCPILQEVILAMAAAKRSG
jgi:speckle-type POZ protein